MSGIFSRNYKADREIKVLQAYGSEQALHIPNLIGTKNSIQIDVRKYPLTS